MPNQGSGAGGANTNAHGKKFERDVFTRVIGTIPSSCLTERRDLCSATQDFFEINKRGKMVGLIGTQGTIFKYFAKNDLNGLKVAPIIHSVWTKMLDPDIFIVDFASKKIHIFELKYQEKGGSVAEKIQSGHYKYLMWNKLFSSFSFSVTYEYILSTKEFWQQTQQNNPLKGKTTFGGAFDYLKSNSINYTIIEADATDYKFKIKDYLK